MIGLEEKGLLKGIFENLRVLILTRLDQKETTSFFHSDSKSQLSVSCCLCLLQHLAELRPSYLTLKSEATSYKGSESYLGPPREVHHCIFSKSMFNSILKGENSKLTRHLLLSICHLSAKCHRLHLQLLTSVRALPSLLAKPLTG